MVKKNKFDGRIGNPVPLSQKVTLNIKKENYYKHNLLGV